MTLNNIAVAIIMVVVSGQWLDVTWAPHPENRWIQALYRCDVPFAAVNIFDILPEDSYARVHRVETPAGARCYVHVSILRSADPLVDPLTDGQTAESAYVEAD